MTGFKKLIIASLVMASAMPLTGCNEDVQIFKKKEPKGVQEPLPAEDMEMGLYYVKDGTRFIETLPLKGSGSNGTPESAIAEENSSRVLYAGPFEDTLIPTHYRNEIVAMSNGDAKWEEVTLERYKDLGYSVGFANAEYNKEENALEFRLQESGVKGTDFFDQVYELESNEIRVVELDHEPLNVTNCNYDCGVLTGMKKGEVHTVSLYSGTYYHELDVTADTQMFQSFEVYSFGKDYVDDTQNGYRGFKTPDYLKSGYYAIDGKGLFRYVDFAKGQGDVESASVNEAYYKSSMEQLAQFSKQFTFYLEQRTKNVVVEATYAEDSVGDEEEIKGFAFAPDGTEYKFILNTEKNTLTLDLSEAMPGRWVVNIVPMEINVVEFHATDNTPDEELTQASFTLTLDEDKENIVIRTPFYTTTEVKSINDVDITGTLVTPDGTTYILEKMEEKDIGGKKRYYMQYTLAYAIAGDYEININHYPERTIVMPPQRVGNTETHTETIVIEG